MKSSRKNRYFSSALLLALSALVILSLMAPAQAVFINIESNDNNPTTVINAYLNHPTNNNTYPSAIGQVFNASNSGYLQNIRVGFTRGSTMTGTVQAIVYQTTGVYGVDMVPSSVIVGVSDPKTIEDTQAGAHVDFYSFNFTTNPYLTAGQKYAFAMIVENAGAFSASKYVSLDVKANQYGGNVVYFMNGAWQPNPSTDAQFWIDGDTTFIDHTGATPTPGPTIAPTPSPVPFVKGVNIVMIFFFGENMDQLGLGVALVIFLVLGILGAKYAGTWGFLGGLTAAAILCYVFGVIGLWAVVLFAMIDAIALIRGTGSSSDKPGKG